MKIFLDTASVNEIKEGVSLGVVDGVTTNPSLAAREKRPFRPLVEEICSIVPGDVSLEVVELGDLAYWPPGHAFCIFFGPTPASRGDECRAASPVNVVGKIQGDPGVFKTVRSGTRVTIERQ